MAGYIQLTDERALFHSTLDSSVKLLPPDRCCHDNAALFSVSKTLLKESYDYSQYNNVFQCADFLFGVSGEEGLSCFDGQVYIHLENNNM